MKPDPPLNNEEFIPSENAERVIDSIQGLHAMLDRDLAKLYGVETRTLKQAVKRNTSRFPGDFMFILTKEEFRNWRSQFVTSISDRMGLRYPPMAFNEQGVAMLSSELRCERTIATNIAIIQAFVNLRNLLTTNAELSRKLEELKRKYDKQLKVIFNAIRAPMAPEAQEKRPIGFKLRELSNSYGK